VNPQVNTFSLSEPIHHLIITGSNGFVGQAFLDFIRILPSNQRPKEITLVSRAPKCSYEIGELEDFVTYISADLSKVWNFSYPGAHLLNLAADGSANSYGLPAALSFELINTNLVNWAKLNAPRKIIHASSGACFGIKPIETLKTASKINVASSETKQRFIESRLLAEQSLQALRAEYGTPISICRLFSFVGIRLLSKKQYAISSFIESAVRERQIIVKGNPDTVRSFLNEKDMSTWLWSALNTAPSNEILSIGSHRGVTLGEVANFIAAQTDSRVILQAPNAFGDEYVADNFMTQEYLNVSESKLWEDSTLECINFLRGIHERG
jgi:nucleoside-diphosphate-sugar epimerase